MAADRIAISPDNRGPIINIISWILIVLTSLATLTKVWSKWTLAKRLGADDWYLIGSLLTAAGWVGVVSLQVNAGLGRHATMIDDEDIILFQKTAYSSDFLYVVSLCLAKMAILHFMLTLARADDRRVAVYVAMVFNLISMVVGIFAIAFQCSLPQTWAILSDKCFDQSSFWVAFGVMDILIDLATVIVPFVLLHDLRTTWKRKMPAIAAFGLRFLIIPMIVVRLVVVRDFANSTDHPFDDFDTILATSVHVNFSVIFTCLPFLKTVMDNIQTGLLGGEIHARDASRIYGYSHGYKFGQSGHQGNYIMQYSGLYSARRSSNKSGQKIRNLSYDPGWSRCGRNANNDPPRHHSTGHFSGNYNLSVSDRSVSHDLCRPLDCREPPWDYQQHLIQQNPNYDHANKSTKAHYYGNPDLSRIFASSGRSFA